MKVIKSFTVKKCVISLRYISPDFYGVFVQEQPTKTGTYNEVDIDFCNAVEVFLNPPIEKKEIAL